MAAPQSCKFVSNSIQTTPTKSQQIYKHGKCIKPKDQLIPNSHPPNPNQIPKLGKSQLIPIFFLDYSKGSILFLWNFIRVKILPKRSISRESHNIPKMLESPMGMLPPLVYHHLFQPDNPKCPKSHMDTIRGWSLEWVLLLFCPWQNQIFVF